MDKPNIILDELAVAFMWLKKNHPSTYDEIKKMFVAEVNKRRKQDASNKRGKN